MAALESRAADQAVIREGLDRLADQLKDLHHDRATWQGEFNAQVQGMRMTTESLRRETSSLATALRKPQVRGRWGEMHLRRAVELAGMVDRCDFTEQHQLDDGARRPDLVVHLAGGRQVVVDAKVPLDAFLDATGSDDDEERRAHLARHARQLRTHVDGLAAKAYWKSLPGTPEFVVLFVPAEAFLSAALEAEPEPARPRGRASGRAGHPDHPDRPAPHGRAWAGARRPSPPRWPRSSGWAASSTSGSAPWATTWPRSAAA